MKNLAITVCFDDFRGQKLKNSAAEFEGFFAARSFATALSVALQKYFSPG
jgi:hypothetical protein